MCFYSLHIVANQLIIYSYRLGSIREVLSRREYSSISRSDQVSRVIVLFGMYVQLINQDEYKML